ncbi:MFS transporter [Streptomyces sp. NBC_01237]|uniref:MFS transporter n=1 Tax=Streptomyces sp. NBC_01237 TaxID=2903790 RepID=UPI002DDA2ECC|nr:MFS transporter [Streptomyces sp. NBC_01237]WRZ78023.1 MFS transporter [Streptomyces sp. NBC_01237]
MSKAPAVPRFSQVFVIREFRMLWLAQLISVGGNQLARVALAVLVFDRSASAGLAALTYALTLLPELVGGPMLSWLADRYPRRGLMVVCDLVRTGLVAVMAVPGTPLWLLCALVVAVQLVQSPHMAARAALLPTIALGERYLAASAVVNLTAQLGQLAGFAAGGAVVAALGPSQALLVNAGTFTLSAVLTRFGLARRPRPRPSGPAPAGARWSVITGGAGLVRADRRLRLLMAFGAVSGFYACKEGLATPYAETLGEGPAGAGFLLAASPAGAVVGMLVITRWVKPDRALKLLGPLAVASCAVLMLTPVSSGIAVTCVLWAASGLFSAFQLPANAEYSLSVPDSERGKAFGLASASVRVAQGAGISLAGLATAVAPVPHVIAAFGAVGAAASGLLAIRWSRMPPRVADSTGEPVRAPNRLTSRPPDLSKDLE